MTTNITLGASDNPAICEVNPYQTPWDIYDRKVNPKTYTGNKYTEAGDLLEPIILDSFSKRRDIVLGDFQKKYVHDYFHYMICKVDAVGKEMDKQYIISAKNTASIVDKEDLPDTWTYQINMEMGLSGIHEGYITWLSRGVDFDDVKVFFDEDLYNYQVSCNKYFWESYILTLIPPPPINSKEILSRTTPKDRSVKEAGQEYIDKIILLRETKEQLKPLELLKEEIEEELKVFLSENTELMVGNRLLCSWRRNKDSETYDWEALKETYPDIAEQFKITKPGARVLRLNNK